MVGSLVEFHMLSIVEGTHVFIFVSGGGAFVRCFDTPVKQRHKTCSRWWFQIFDL